MNKRLLSTAVIAIVSVAAAFAQYKIYGHVPDLEDGIMYLEVERGRVDSAKVENGCFNIENKEGMEATTYVHMRHSSNRWQCAFWMGNDNIDFTTVNDIPVIKGSKTQDEYNIYKQTLQPVWDYGLELKKQMNDVTKHDSLMNIVNTVYKVREDSVFMTFLKKYPKSYISLNHVYNMRVWNKYPYKRYIKFFNELDTTAFKGKQWLTMLELIEKDHAMEPGQPMPKFEMADLYGKSISLASFKGKCVLFTVSSYGVADYDADLMLRKQLYGKYASKGLDMVDYMLNEDIIDVMKGPANMGLRWHFVTDLKGFNGKWIGEHEIDHITQNFLIDRNGVIIGRNLFGDELEREINNLFK
ncbi:MAG: DUF4369 domain-containing protein [Prevotella sp.]